MHREVTFSWVEKDTPLELARIEGKKPEFCLF